MSGSAHNSSVESMHQPGRALRKRPADTKRDDSKRARRGGGQPIAGLAEAEAVAPRDGAPAQAAERHFGVAAANRAPTAATAAHVGEAQQTQTAQQVQHGKEAVALREQLAEAHDVFQHQRGAGQRQLFLEVDVAKQLKPLALVGRQLRVYWPGDDAWYLGTVEQYDNNTLQHTIHYADSQVEDEILAFERIRLLMRPGEQLQPPQSGQLSVCVQRLRERLQELVKLPKYREQALRLRERIAKLALWCKQMVDAERAEAAQASAPSPAQQQQALEQQAFSGDDKGCGAAVPPAHTAAPAASPCAQQLPLCKEALPPSEPPWHCHQPPPQHPALSTVARALKLAAELPEDVHLKGVQRCGQAGSASYAIKLQYDKKSIWLGLLSREQAVVAKDLANLACAARRNQPMGKLLCSPAGYSKDADLMEQLGKSQPPEDLRDYLKYLVVEAAQLQHTAQQEGGGEEEQEEEEVEKQQQEQGQAQQQGLAVEHQLDRQPSEQRRQQHEGLQPPADLHQQQATDAPSKIAGLPLRKPVLLPGEVAWFKACGYPHWPCMAITMDEAIARGVPASHFRNPAYLAVHYFGSGEVQAVNPAAEEKGRSKKHPKHLFAQFLEGLDLGYHAPARCRKLNEFRRAICELHSYLKEGELPPCMAPRHNDGMGVEDETELEVESMQPTVKRRKSKGKGSALTPGGATEQVQPDRLPSQMNQHLRLLALGEVEWLHPAFHSEKYIFPVGYKAQRLAKTPASNYEVVPHLLEILRAKDRSGPVFRVTPEGYAPVEGPTASKAWQALFAEAQARAVGMSGCTAFGLTIKSVQRAIEALPGAHRCERYCDWPEGVQPEVPPLSEAEQRQRLAFEAYMQRLPEGLEGVPVAHSAAGVCHVCNDETEDDQDMIVQCNKCRVFVHMTCYGVQEPPNGSRWLCDVCSLNLRHPPACALCPVLGGALKRTSCGRWAHPACALWLPETCTDFDATRLHLRGLVQGVQQVHSSRRQLTCQVCKQQHGACIQCCHKRCYVGFHPLCARQAGYKMMYAPFCESDEEEESTALEVVPPAQQEVPLTALEAVTAQHEMPGHHSVTVQQECEGTEASCNENDAAAPNFSSKGTSQYVNSSEAQAQGQVAAAAAAAAASASVPRPKRQQKRERQEGTLVNNVLLLAYCPKHGGCGKPLAPLGRQQSSVAAAAAARDMLPPSCSAGDVEEGTRQHQLSRQHSLAGLPPAGNLSAAMSASNDQLQFAAVDAVPAGCTLAVWGAARARRFTHAARRGQRAPEAVAAAEAKRTLLKSIPYLVGGPPYEHLGNLPLSQKCHLEQPVRAQCVEQEEEAEEHHPAAFLAANSAANLQRQQAQHPLHQQQNCSSKQAEQLPGSPTGVATAGHEQLPASPGQEVQSDAESFAQMRATQGQRVTIGKSGIHGWGAFAKQRHAAHDMVIEYVGELVRPSVSDLRERRMYDAMVGAGTYVFRLNMCTCVDATRAGNLAHMLNHSCDPNCYSRTISITEGGKVVDHVVIFARRDIKVGEELTYDYRFSGEEQLPCTCGALNCRGRVNEQPKEEELWVKRRQLKPFIPPRTAPVQQWVQQLAH